MSTIENSGAERVGGGCGVSGCLYAAVALFAILLVGMLVLAVIRFSSPPEPRNAPLGAPTAVSSAGSPAMSPPEPHGGRLDG